MCFFSDSVYVLIYVGKVAQIICRGAFWIEDHKFITCFDCAVWIAFEGDFIKILDRVPLR